MCPFPQNITISSICNKVFRTIFLKEKTVGIIPKEVYRMGDRQSVVALQWLAYIGQRTIVFIPAMGGRFVCLACHIRNLMGFVVRLIKSKYLGCFGKSVPPACPIGTRPSATPKKQQADEMKQWHGYKRLEMQDIMMFRPGV
jgi:hypothetical protein